MRRPSRLCSRRPDARVEVGRSGDQLAPLALTTPLGAVELLTLNLPGRSRPHSTLTLTYQVELDSPEGSSEGEQGELIYAPADLDACIRTA